MQWNIIKSGVGGGFVLFIWLSISWMLLPFHSATLHSFKEERVVKQVIQAQAPQAGMYIIPGMHPPSDGVEQETKQPDALILFAAVHPEGKVYAMWPAMFIELLVDILLASLVALLLSKTRQSTYFKRVCFVMTIALILAIAAYVPYWNWFGFSGLFSLVGMFDTLMGWFLASLIIARWVVHKAN